MRWYFAGMRSTWPYFAAVVAVGLGVGTWIAGLPRSDTGITIADGGEGPIGPGVQNTVGLLPTSSFPPITVTPTTVNPATVTPTTVTSTTEPIRNPVPPITTLPAALPTTTLAPTASVPATTTAPPSTSAPATTTAPPAPAATDLLDRALVRLVVANGDGRYNLVGRNVDRLIPLGYTSIDQTDAPRKVPRTVLYIRPGFEEEATRLASDLLVPGALIEPLPGQAVTINDELGDIIVVLGPDAVR